MDAQVSLRTSSLYFQSSLDHLHYLIQCKCFVNSYTGDYILINIHIFHMLYFNYKTATHTHIYDHFFKFYFIFKLYIIVLALPNIKMNPPQVYMCSPSWTLLPPPSPYHPSGSSQCTSPKHPVACIKPGLATRFLHDILHVSMSFSQYFILFNVWVIFHCTYVPHLLSPFLPEKWYNLDIWGYLYFSKQSWSQLVLLPAQRFSWCTLHIVEDVFRDGKRMVLDPKKFYLNYGQI